MSVPRPITLKTRNFEKELDILFDKLQTYLDKFDEQDTP